MKKITITQKL